MTIDEFKALKAGDVVATHGNFYVLTKDVEHYMLDVYYIKCVLLYSDSSYSFDRIGDRLFYSSRVSNLFTKIDYERS